MGTKDKSTLQCPNGCGPLVPFKQSDSQGWECPKCGYFYNTKAQDRWDGDEMELQPNYERI